LRLRPRSTAVSSSPTARILPASSKYPGDLSEEETLAMAVDWKMAHQGIGNAQYPAILTAGAEWKTVSIAPDDAQFLETRSFQRSDIASFFRIPEHMLGIQDKTSSWGTGIEQMDIGFMVNTLQPWINRIEAYMSRLLPPNQVAKFDLTGRMRGDSGQRASYYTTMINAGLMSGDEARAFEDLPPLPNGEGQIFYRPTNFTTTTQMKDNPPAPGTSGGIGGGIDQAPDAPAPGGPQSGPGNDSQKKEA
jgi:phage portal protein BeeE